MIAVCSDKGTLHIYNILIDDLQKTENKKSMFNPFAKVIPFLGSEWSFAHFTFSEEEKVTETKCAFVSDTKVALLSEKGKYMLLEIDVQNKELVLK